MQKMMNITHKDDLDGLGCNIVAGLYTLGLQIGMDTMELGYKDVDEKICEFINSGKYKEYSHITIMDLGIKLETAELIENTRMEIPEIEWQLIDHHISNYFLNKYDWARVTEMDDNGALISATKLAYCEWEEVISKEFDIRNVVTEFANNISDYDTYTWKEKGNQNAKDMHDLLCLLGREEFRKRMVNNLIDSISNGSLILFTNEEKFVIEINKKKIKNYIEKKMKYLNFIKIKLNDDRVLNVAVTIIDEKEYISELGNYICETIPDKADVAMMICPASQDVSMRCVREDINLGEDIAKLLGGGGHAKAAGFPIIGIRGNIIYGRIVDDFINVGLYTHDIM